MGNPERIAADQGLHGGFIDSIPPHLIGVSESPNAVNLDPRSLLGAKTRNGRDIFAQYGQASLCGLVAWSRQLGTSYVVSRNGTTFLGYDSSGSVASIGIGGDSGDPLTGAPLDNTLIIAVDGLAPQKWNGVDAMSAIGGSPPSEAKYCVVHISKVWLAGDDANPQTKYFSATNNSEDWTATDDAGSITTQEGGGDRILGMASNRLVLLTFYRRFVDVLAGYSTANFTEQRLTDRGLVSETGYATAGDVVFFASDDAVYMVAGTRVSDITTMKIRESYQAISDKSKISLGIAGDLLLVVDWGNGTAYACDWKRNVWSIWENQEWRHMSTANAGTFFGSFQTSASDSAIMEIDSGSVDQLGTMLSTVTITAKWRTPNLSWGWPDAIKNLNAVRVHAKPTSFASGVNVFGDAGTITINYYKDGVDTGASSVLTFASTGDHDWAGRAGQTLVRGHFIGLEMSWNGAGTIYGWAVYGEVTTDPGTIPVEA